MTRLSGYRFFGRVRPHLILQLAPNPLSNIQNFSWDLGVGFWLALRVQTSSTWKQTPSKLFGAWENDIKNGVAVVCASNCYFTRVVTVDNVQFSTWKNNSQTIIIKLDSLTALQKASNTIWLFSKVNEIKINISSAKKIRSRFKNFIVTSEHNRLAFLTKIIVQLYFHKNIKLLTIYLSLSLIDLFVFFC